MIEPPPPRNFTIKVNEVELGFICDGLKAYIRKQPPDQDGDAYALMAYHLLYRIGKYYEKRKKEID